MRGTNRYEAVTSYLGSPGGRDTSDVTAALLHSVSLDAYGLSDPPSMAQLHRTRLVLDSFARENAFWSETSGVRLCPARPYQKKQPSRAG